MSVPDQREDTDKLADSPVRGTRRALDAVQRALNSVQRALNSVQRALDAVQRALDDASSVDGGQAPAGGAAGGTDLRSLGSLSVSDRCEDTDKLAGSPVRGTRG